MATPRTNFRAKFRDDPNSALKDLSSYVDRLAEVAGVDEKKRKKMEAECKKGLKDLGSEKKGSKEPKKATKKGGKNLTIVLNYSKTSHAIIGEDGGNIESLLAPIAKKINAKLGNTLSKSRLTIGSGYIFKDKNSLSDLEEALKKHKIEYRTIEKEDYCEEKNLTKGGKAATRKVGKKPSAKTSKPKKTKSSSDSSSSESESEGEEKPSKSTKTSKTKTEVPSGPKLKKNKRGNMEEENSNIVFESLPVGAGNRNIEVAVGVQASRKGDGLESVDPLTEDAKNICQERQWKILNPNMLTTLRKVKHKKVEALEKLLESPEEEEEDDESSSENEEEEDNEEEEGGEDEDDVEEDEDEESD